MTMTPKHPHGYSLWDTDTANVIDYFSDLTALARACFEMGQANPTGNTAYKATDLQVVDDADLDCACSELVDVAR